MKQNYKTKEETLLGFYIKGVVKVLVGAMLLALLTLGIGLITMNFISGCGDHWYDSKGNVHYGECVGVFELIE